MKNEILEFIHSVITDELHITLYSKLSTDTPIPSLGIDSLSLMTIIVYLENEYNCEISFDDRNIENFTQLTFDDIINKIISQKSIG